MIVLYNPVSSASKKPVLPMSLLALGALLEGVEDYRIVDGNVVADGLSAVREALRETNADILAMTVMPGPQLSNAVPICKAIKAEFKNLPIVWGGYFPTLHGGVAMKEPYVDFIFRGHTERSFARFLTAFRRGEDVCALEGIGSRGSDGTVRLNPVSSVPNINELPDFPYHRVDMERYVRASFLGARTIAHHSSYGCPFKCNFCAVVNQVNGRYSAQTAARTAAVVDNLVRNYRATAIEFFDSNFFVHEGRAVEFSERITPLGIGWWAFGRPDTMLKFSDATFAAMQKSGLKMVFMGGEAGDDDMLHRMNRGGKHDTNTILGIVEKMARFNIVPEVSFIVGNPPDPETDLDKTLAFIRRVKRVNPASEIIFNVYSPVPLAGTMTNEARSAGFVFPETVDMWLQAPWEEFAQHRSSELPWMTKRVRRKVRNFQQVLHAAYPTVTDIRLTPLARLALKSVASWRYAAKFYDFPLELRAVNRIFPYHRPEIDGF